MRTLIIIHRYLSCVAAPAMIFFAISGAWQAFRWQESRKDGYTAPEFLKKLSYLHKAEHLEGAAAFYFKAGQCVVAAVFLVTAVVGIAMAFKVTKPAWRVWACLIAGVVVPVALALMALKS